METGVLGVNHSNQARSGSEEVTPESECHGGPLRRHSSYTSIQLLRKLRCLKKLTQEPGTVYDPIIPTPRRWMQNDYGFKDSLDTQWPKACLTHLMRTCL